MFFVTPAYAQAAGAAGGAADVLVQMAPFGIILLIMYLLILRPQQKRAKEHETMVKNIRRGDTVVTNSGLIGRVSRVADDSEIEIEIAPNVRIRQLRAGVAEVRSKGEPVKDEAPAPAKKELPAKQQKGKAPPAKVEPPKVQPANDEPAKDPSKDQA
jgi:preprotein translocase subunit YajC